MRRSGLAGRHLAVVHCHLASLLRTPFSVLLKRCHAVVCVSGFWSVAAVLPSTVGRPGFHGIATTDSSAGSHVYLPLRRRAPSPVTSWRVRCVATDVETGVATQHRSREAALEHLGEAVAIHDDEIGRKPTDEVLCELSIDPADTITGDQNRRTYSNRDDNGRSPERRS